MTCSAVLHDHALEGSGLAHEIFVDIRAPLSDFRRSKSERATSQKMSRLASATAVRDRSSANRFENRMAWFHFCGATPHLEGHKHGRSVSSISAQMLDGLQPNSQNGKVHFVVRLMTDPDTPRPVTNFGGVGRIVKARFR